MADQTLLSSDTSGLDRAGWARLGQIAEATQTALFQQPPAPAASDERKGPNVLGALLAETLATLQRDWHRLFHPLESLREWWANQTQGQAPYQDHGSGRAESPPPNQPTPPDRGPTLDQTWTTVRDQLFEAAKNPQADPQKVADSIVGSIPTDHRAAMTERLGWLAEMAQTTAQTLQQTEVKAPAQSAEPERAPLGEPPPEQKLEPPLPENVRLFKTKPERQVPKQPLPDTPKVTRSAQAQADSPAKAKAR